MGSTRVLAWSPVETGGCPHRRRRSAGVGGVRATLERSVMIAAPDDRAVELASHRLALACEVVNRAAQDSARARRIAADAAREASRAGVPVAQIARALGCSPATVRRWSVNRLRNLLAASRVGGNVVLDSLLRPPTTSEVRTDRHHGPELW